MTRLILPLFALAVLAPTSAARAGAPAETPATDPAGVEFFEKKIRPVLAEHCYKCHSAEAQKGGKLKGELLLDTRAGVLNGGDLGAVIIPGDPDKSLLVKALRHTDAKLKMPPRQKLPDAVVADFAQWVKMGAPDPRVGGPAAAGARKIDLEAGAKFWSFRPLADVTVPDVKADNGWCRTPADRFVFTKLKEKGLAPNPPAEKRVLIRRAYFGLTGLPPAPEDVEAFEKDQSPDAYEKLIDRLLASPAYGERWARHWLDVARFAESDGFEHDNARPHAYHYRDFVIRALNDDMPYNQFAAWQIAGDELAPDDPQAMAATGFLSAGVFPTQITEKEFEVTRYNELDDMVATAGNAFLGLTVGCARCHDHKFDPIPTQDYYRLTAAFATAIRSDIDIDQSTPQEREQAKQLAEARRKVVNEQIAAFERDALGPQFGAFVAKVKQQPDLVRSGWAVLDIQDVKTANGTQLAKQPDGSLLKTGNTPDRDTYTLTALTHAAGLTALRLEALTHPSLPAGGGPGAADNGNFCLSEIIVAAAPADGSAAPAPVKIASAAATHQQDAGNLSVAASLEDNAASGWAVDQGGIGKDQAAILWFDKPVGFPGGTLLRITLRFDHPNGRHLMGRPRLSVTTLPEPTDFKGPEGPDPVVAQVLERLAAGEAVPPAEVEPARKWFASTLPEYRKLTEELVGAGADAAPKRPVKVQVTSEGLPPVGNHADGRGYPHFYKDVYLLRRGDPNNKAEVVTPSFPRVLMRGGKTEAHWQTPPPAGWRTSYRRRAVAAWMTDVDHGAGHLMARVIVNRVWHYHFGRGIVATPNDFGAQGERPTNSQLLDWLAADFIKSGWKLKRLHKLILTGAAYTQGAQNSSDRAAIDPHNVYLWRWSPRRLEAEPIRDAMLAVSGLLDPTMYGPGTLDENSRRRSVYFMVKRAQLIPMMMVLDWPEPLNSIGSRPVTTIAPQALLFLNSPQARQYAEAFAQRVKAPSVAESVDRAYRIAVGRKPTGTEADLAVAFVANQEKSYREVGVGDPATPALADFCQALMSTNEFVYVE